MEKIKILDSFHGMRGFSFNGMSISDSNIDNFDLILIFESDIADIYKKRKKDKIFYIKYKKNQYADWQEKPIGYAGEVDWAECELSDTISELKKESTNYIDYRWKKSKN